MGDDVSYACLFLVFLSPFNFNRYVTHSQIYKCQRIPRLGADSSNGNHALNAGPQTGVCPGSAGALPVTKV